MKIYVVTAGSYSDYRIEKVFTDKDKAEEFATWCYDSNGVDEWDTEDELSVEKYYCINVQYKLYDNGKKENPIVSVYNYADDNYDYSYTSLSDYHRYGGNYIVLNIRRFVKANNDTKDFYKQKYTKIAYDTMAMIKQLVADGYSYSQIEKMLENNVNEVV
jgi:hypothetical protein